MTISGILTALRDHLHNDVGLSSWRSDYASHGRWLTEILIELPDEDDAGRPDVVDRVCPYLAIVPIGVQAVDAFTPVPESRLLVIMLGVLESQSERQPASKLQNFSGAFLKALTKKTECGIGWVIDSGVQEEGGNISKADDIDLVPYEEQRSFVATIEIELVRDTIFGRAF